MRWKIRDTRSKGGAIMTGEGKSAKDCKAKALRALNGKDFPPINPKNLEIVVEE